MESTKLPDNRAHFIYPFSIASEIERPRDHISDFENRLQSCSIETVFEQLESLGYQFNPILYGTSAWCRVDWNYLEESKKNNRDDNLFLPGEDLLKPIADIATGNCDLDLQIAAHWCLSSHLMECISVAKLSVFMNSSALTRLGCVEGEMPLEYSVTDCNITAFASGIGFLHLSIRYQLSENGIRHFESNSAIEVAQLIVEANYALSHRKSTYQSGVAKFTEAIFRSSGLLDAEISRRKTFVFTGISFETLTSDQIKQLSITLALKENSAYVRTSETIEIAELWLVNDNLAHAVSSEGGAVVLAGTSTNHFISKFLARNFNDYLTLAKLSLHESTLLNQYSLRLATLGKLDSLSVDDRKMLVEIRKNLYQYRLNYRFVVVSELSRHNHVHTLWRKVMNLDGLEVEVIGDTDQVSAYVSALRTALIDRVSKILAIVISGVGVFVSLDQALDLRIFKGIVQEIVRAIRLVEVTDFNINLKTAFVSSLAIAFVGVLYYLLRTRKRLRVGKRNVGW